MAQHIILANHELTRANFMEKAEPHLALIRQAALKYCNWDEALAEDMVQEMLLKAYSNIDKFNGGNFGAWLYRIMHNNIVSHFRKKHNEVNMDFRPSISETYDAQLTIEDKFADQLGTFDNSGDFLAVEKIKDAIDSLPAYMRNVFKLAAIDELDYKQVAKKLKMPIGTVMSRIFRARKTLQRKLQSMVNDN